MENQKKWRGQSPQRPPFFACMIQVVTSGGHVCNQCKWCHLVVKGAGLFQRAGQTMNQAGERGVIFKLDTIMALLALVANLPTRWQILALVANLATRWRHLHWFQI